MAIAFALAAASLIGPGTDVRVTLSGNSAAGDYIEFLAQLAGVSKWSTAFSIQALPVLSHTPDLIMGWDYGLSKVSRTNVEGLADGTTYNLICNWRNSGGTLIDTGTLSATWTMSHQAALIELDVLQNANSASIALILAAVRRIFQNAP